jgi:hypothetical protein
MKWRFEFMTLTQIGEVFGVSNQQVGKWLAKLGLRTDANRPSREAFDGGYVKEGPSRGQGYNWVWHSEKTVRALTEAGHKSALLLACELMAPCQLNGPFEYRRSPVFGFEVANGDGTVAVWVRGEKNARFVCSVLNAADRCGVVGKVLGKVVEQAPCDDEVPETSVSPAGLEAATTATVDCPSASDIPSEFQFL